ncbi:MORN motif [Babesia duncani]|uniref:MORN motif n=1 Tax=Babesia duncani TaxID=323732 RepID=A0AAD9PMI4_9APIC|nr:MORN motif [Babesia duncani]KAK2197624.1 MORN motif [Babesia duncani]
MAQSKVDGLLEHTKPINQQQSSTSLISRQNTLLSDTWGMVTRNYENFKSFSNSNSGNLGTDECYEYKSIEYPNGSRFVGWFDSEGKRYGHGRIINGNNSYVGHWQDDLPNESGSLNLENGLIYEGKWAAGLVHGHGVVKLPNGSSYVGEWKEGNCDGKGRFVSPEGLVCSGFFKNGLPNGPGYLANSNGVACTCTLIDGVPIGVGEITWPNEKRYLGAIVEGKPHGFGMMMDKSRVTLGLWKRGVLETRLNAHDPIPEAFINDPAVLYIQEQRLLESDPKDTPESLIEKVDSSSGQ